MEASNEIKEAIATKEREIETQSLNICVVRKRLNYTKAQIQEKSSMDKK